MPKFSIIVPIYNAEKYLEECLDSILNQTFTDFELILIDDGSKDNSWAICNEYAEKDLRIKTFHKENGGVSSARNLGITKAKGEWLTFIDSDDTISENFLLKCCNNISSNTDLVLTSWKTIGDKEEVFRRSNFHGNLLDFWQTNYFPFHLLAPWGCVFKKSIIEKLGLLFDESLVMSEDRLFDLEYSFNASHFVSLDFIGYNYRLNPMSACGSCVTKKKLDSQINAAIKICNLANKYALTPNYRLIINDVLTDCILGNYIKHIKETKEKIDYVYDLTNVCEACKRNKIDIRLKRLKLLLRFPYITYTLFKKRFND